MSTDQMITDIMSLVDRAYKLGSEGYESEKDGDDA